jgi:hypothetical protein
MIGAGMFAAGKASIKMEDKLVTVSVQVQANPSDGGTIFTFSVPAMLSELIEPNMATPGALSVIAFLQKAAQAI